MMKITRKEFTEILMEHSSVFMGSLFRWNDERCINAMGKIGSVDKNAVHRTVKENHSEYLLFSDDGRLYCDQCGKKEYFKHINKSGISFLLQKTTVHDNFDDMDYMNYIIYAIIRSETLSNRIYRKI